MEAPGTSAASPNICQNVITVVSLCNTGRTDRGGWMDALQRTKMSTTQGYSSPMAAFECCRWEASWQGAHAVRHWVDLANARNGVHLFSRESLVREAQ